MQKERHRIPDLLHKCHAISDLRDQPGTSVGAAPELTQGGKQNAARVRLEGFFANQAITDSFVSCIGYALCSAG
jgi:hypothetical protein